MVNSFNIPMLLGTLLLVASRGELSEIFVRSLTIDRSGRTLHVSITNSWPTTYNVSELSVALIATLLLFVSGLAFI